ncbi:ABC transporter ATP-binding protein [Prochlorococcus sp. MIT 1011]|uniref:ABC transporter ATP-binding protein n=1 Tax=Prochlorococcus sp. MIT 1011 TaxID=3082520 RepID=UPI0039B5FF2E
MPDSKSNIKLNNSGIFFLIKFIWKIIRPKLKLQLLVLILLMLLSGISEAITIGSVIPFISIIINPDNLWNIDLIQKISKIFSINSPDELIVPVTILFLSTIIFAAIIRLLNLWLGYKYSANLGTEICFEAYKRSLGRSYITHITTNSSDIISNISVEMNLLIALISKILLLISSTIQASFIIITLIIIDYKLIILLSTVFLISYKIIGMISGNRLKRLSKVISKRFAIQIKLLQESLGGIRYIIMNRIQPYYLNSFIINESELRNSKAKSSFLQTFSNLAIDPIYIISFIFYSLFILKSEKADPTSLIQSLGSLTLGTQRLLPSMKQIYTAWAKLKAATASTNKIVELLTEPEKNIDINVNDEDNVNTINFIKSIEISNLNYRYPSSSRKVLNNINISIKKGDRIGIIGKTGSGKSTLIDLIMGLIKPSSGEILIDNINLYNNSKFLNGWRYSISHIPQEIFLIDSTIEENIALGVEKDFINYKKLRKASHLAKIDTFIEKLPKKFKTTVGERGINFSGGQKQRIGIARAMYKESKIIILDEATSSLDSSTEKQIIDSINKLDPEITMIMISHRLSTLKKCNKIYKLDNGELIGRYSVDEIKNLS